MEEEMADQTTPLGDEFGEFGVLVHTITKSNKEQIRISLNEYRGSEYIDIRSFFQVEGLFKPSRRGITLPTRLYATLLDGVIELGPLLGFDATAPETDDLDGDSDASRAGN